MKIISLYYVATLDNMAVMGILSFLGFVAVLVIVSLIVCRSRVKETVCRILPPNKKDPPEISHLQTPDDWFIKCEDAGWRYCDHTLLRFGFEPAHHIQYDRFEGPISIKSGPKSGLGDANLANAWTMVEMLKDKKMIPDEWKGKRIVFAGSSYYRTRPYTLRKRYFENNCQYSNYRTVHGIRDDGVFVPVLCYRDRPKMILGTRRADFEYRNGPTDPHEHNSYYIGIGQYESPPGWEVEFVRLGDLKDDSDLFFAVVPDGTTVLNKKSYESPPSTYGYLSELSKSDSVNYDLLPVNKDSGYSSGRLW